VITDDEVMRLFERADPARDDDVASVIDATGYLDALRTRSSYVTTVEINPRHTGSPSRHRWRLIAAAAAAGVLIIGGALMLAATRDDAAGPVTDTPENPPAETAEVVAIAEDFMEARNDHDIEAALSMVADDGVEAQLCDQSVVPRYACTNDVATELVMGHVRLDHDAMALAFEAERIYGVRYRSYACEKDSGSYVTCTYRMDSRLRRIVGLPPVEASSSFSIEDGRVRRLAFPWLNIGFNPGGYNPMEAEPFLQWLEHAHPEALDGGQLVTLDGPLFRTQGQELVLVLNRESLDLLAGHLDEYEATDPSSKQPGDGPATTTRLSRTVSGVAFSLVAPNPPWTPGGPSDGLYVSQSTVGPQNAEAVVLWTGFPDGDEADPCPRLLDPAVGASATDLAATVASAPGTELVRAPTDVRVGGRPAQHIVVTVREDLGCDPGYFYTWRDTAGGPFWAGTDPGTTIDVWIVDVAGTLLVIEAETTPQAGAEAHREIRQVLNSIRFDT
jgi:hypothetical protein